MLYIKKTAKDTLGKFTTKTGQSWQNWNLVLVFLGKALIDLYSKCSGFNTCNVT